MCIINVNLDVGVEQTDIPEKPFSDPPRVSRGAVSRREDADVEANKVSVGEEGGCVISRVERS